jgi:predicted nuclease with RNAse H fold
VNTPDLYAGIDVQERRGLPYCILDHNAVMVTSGWVNGDCDNKQAEVMRETLQAIACGARIAIGVDAPRMPLPDVRQWYWNGTKKQWRPKRSSDKGLGRHCEVVVKSLGLANPQWTPLIGESPTWMRLGYVLFRELETIGDVYEVFPSASYTALQQMEVHATIELSQFKPGPKDMIDAIVGAATVQEFVCGRGWEAGGGDGFGSIVLPGPTPPDSPCMQWPGTSV